MSPDADSDTMDPLQAGVLSPTKSLKRTRLGTAGVIGIVIGAAIMVAAILGLSFWLWRRRQMGSVSGRQLAIVEEKSGPGVGTMVEVLETKELNDREKALPSHPRSPRTPDLEESVFPPHRESNLTPNFEYSPPPAVDIALASQLQPAIYNPSQATNLQPTTYSPAQAKDLQPELSTSSKEANQGKYQSMVSSFVPSNPAHKSAASSFFASIPILLDSTEGRCEDCLKNQEKFRFADQSADLSPPVCTCASKHPESEPHRSSPAINNSRGVSGLTISRPEADDELLVNRVKTLMPEASNARESRISEWTDELGYDTDESDAKPLRSNPINPPGRPLFARRPSSKETFDFGFMNRKKRKS